MGEPNAVGELTLESAATDCLDFRTKSILSFPDGERLGWTSSSRCQENVDHFPVTAVKFKAKLMSGG